MSELDKAYERALTFLEKRDRTEKEVYDRLVKAGFSGGTALAAVDRLRGAGLVDDETYAARYLQALAAKGRGRLRIAEEMRRKGLPDGLVRNAVEDGLSPEDERERAAAAARRAWEAVPEGTDGRKAFARVNRRLVTLGFSYDVIGRVMNDIRAGADVNIDLEE